MTTDPSIFNSQRWLWIELIGFEIGDADYGVGRLLQKTGFPPDGITLLLSDPEFVHGHNDDEERLLRPSICSYDAHPYNEERSLQAWTSRHLKGLVSALQAHGIKVFFTHFDAPVDASAASFPEIQFINRKGDRLSFLCPYKRLRSKQLYRDFYLPLMAQTVRDYGFDGFHAGDGFAHPRIPIYEGDFSDDTVEQFLLWSGTPLPPSLLLRTDEHVDALAERAEWLWQHRRAEFIAFQRHRTLEFWSQAAVLLHADGKLLYLNSCWTRDPFEALYRYGVDYSALARAGVDGFFAETAAAAHEYGGDLPYKEGGHNLWDPSHILSRFATKLLLLRAAAPDSAIVFMNGIKDTNEAWCGIRHAPTNVESEILLYTGLFHVQENGALRPSSTGPLCTLSDGLRPHEWEWLRTRWDLGYSLHPQRLLGAAVYWSDSYPSALVKDYASTRRTPFDRILWQMSVQGAPILATVRAEGLPAWRGPLLVVHPHLLPEEEWQKLRRWQGGPIISIGGARPRDHGFEPCYRIAESCGPDALELAIHHWEGESLEAPLLPEPAPFNSSTATDPLQWLDDLPARQISSTFLHHVAEWVITLSQGVRILENRADVRAWAYEITPGSLRIHVRNDGFYYRTAVVDAGRKLSGVKTLTAFPGNPVRMEGTVFRFKIAGKSMAIFEATLAAPPLQNAL